MTPTTSPTTPCQIDRALSTCAGANHDVIEDEHLRALGLSYRGKRTRIARGVLHPVTRTLSIFGSKRLTMWGRARIGECAGGQGSFVTGWLALRAHGVVDFEADLVIVVTPHRRCAIDHSAVKVRFRRTVRSAADEHSQVEDVEFATACRAIYDLACTVDVQRLIRLLRETTFQRVGSVDELERIAARYPSTPNAARCREVVRLYRRGDQGSRSRSEAEIYRAIVDCWIVPARLNQLSGVFLDGKEIELDVSWPGHPVTLELDGGDHLDVAVARADASTDRALRAAGKFPIRVLNDEFQYRFDEALADLVASLERLAPAGYREAVARGEIT